jgi:hypothetical protein
MSKLLSYRSEAEEDLEDIREYYDKISEKLTDNLTLKYTEQGPRYV